MNYASVSHHAYDTFCYPLSKDHLKLSLQTGKDIQKVFIIWGDPFLSDNINGKWTWRCQKLELVEKHETQSHFIWSTTIMPPFKRCRYYFELSDANETKYFFEDGFFEANEKSPEEHVQFIFPWMNEADICTVPEWATQTVWYQIFPARFAHGINPQDPHTLLPWAGPEKEVRNEERYGGNLRGIIDKLDYLKKLGINGLYLNPVNLSHSQHKYDTTDYLQIDPEFGTREDMKELVQSAHEKGMRVMLDGVFNHSGWDFFAWQDVIKNRENSKYASWYMIKDFNFADHPTDAASKGKFFSFALTDYMPKLNTNNPEVREYVVNVCTHWVQDYGIDALRLDVANEISHELCKDLHRAMRALKPDFFIVGEIWNHALPWLRGDEFDSVINYPLRTAITDFAEDKSLSVKNFQEQLNLCLTMYYEQTEKVLLNQLDSHDTIRLITKTGNRNTTLQEFALLFMIPGSTCIYYGTEVLLKGKHDPDCRRCMPWKEIENGEYKEELNIFSALIKARKEHPALTCNSINFIYNDKVSEKSRIMLLIKDDAANNERILFAANFSEEEYVLPEDFSDGKILVSNLFADNKILPDGFVVKILD